VTELVASIGPPTVSAVVFELEPTISTPTFVVDPAVGKVTVSANVAVLSGVIVSVPAVLMFRARLPAAFANLFPSNEISPDEAPPAPILVSPDPKVLKIAPLLPRKVMRPVVAEIVALLMSKE
jgi:hypothetical protein